jgi:hypothetical protein
MALLPSASVSESSLNDVDELGILRLLGRGDRKELCADGPKESIDIGAEPTSASFILA